MWWGQCDDDIIQSRRWGNRKPGREGYRFHNTPGSLSTVTYATSQSKEFWERVQPKFIQVKKEEMRCSDCQAYPDDVEAD